MLTNILTLIVAFLITILAIPFVKKIAKYYNAYDHPNYRKNHKGKVPLMGGIAIFVGTIAGLVFGYDYSNIYHTLIICGAFSMLVLGVVDDKIDMGAKAKFLLPLLASLTIISAGVRMLSVQIYVLSVLLTVVWVVGLTNAFNYIDGMDGLALTVAILCSLSFVVIYSFSGNQSGLILALAILGASIAFLIQNKKPAKIFLGDSGSMLLGFLLASLPLIGLWRSATMSFTYLIIPPIIFAFPILDAFLVTFLRIVHKQRPWLPDLNHSFHRLLRAGLTYGKTFFLIITFVFLSQLIALSLLFFKNLTIFLVVLFVITLFLIFKKMDSFKVNSYAK